MKDQKNLLKTLTVLVWIYLVAKMIKMMRMMVLVCILAKQNMLFKAAQLACEHAPWINERSIQPIRQFGKIYMAVVVSLKEFSLPRCKDQH